MQIVNGIIGAITAKTTSTQKQTPFLEVVIYSLDHQTEDNNNKPIYVRVWEPFINEFQTRVKVKDRVQLPVDRIRENLTLKDGKPVSYLNANFAMFTYLYSGSNSGSRNNTNGNSNAASGNNGQQRSNQQYQQNNQNRQGNQYQQNQQQNQYQQNNQYQQGQQNQYQQQNQQNQQQNQYQQGQQAQNPQKQVDAIAEFLGSI